MSIFSDFAAAHWAASAAAGMLNDCTVRIGRVTKTIKVKYEEPDIFDLGGAQSKRYHIEYLHSDMPTLAQDNELLITERDGTIAKYRVREAPYVDEQRSMDGTYRCAVLTRDQGRDS